MNYNSEIQHNTPVVLINKKELGETQQSAAFNHGTLLTIRCSRVSKLNPFIRLALLLL